jgi:phenylalanyl-tRNA synthetase alpha chain
MILEQDIDRILKQIADADDLAKLEQVRVAILGKKGQITQAMRALGKAAPEEKAKLGAVLNQQKTKITQALNARKAILEQKALTQNLTREKSDITLEAPLASADCGRLHPVWFVMDEVADIFARLGFVFETGPDIESDFYNFTALNIGPDHPARQAHDTFFFPPNAEGETFCLRTHTSPVQIRTMEKGQPPFRFIAPGRVYRRDSDQTHTPMFHQIEGVAIDRDIDLGHLKWLLLYFLRTFFENDAIEIRLRPHFFPFTEPSLEVDMRPSKNDSWLEIAGCGMVHPQVLQNCKIDPEVYQGFAFGFGIDRLAMLKYGIKDLRQFFDHDLDWLTHFGFKLSDEVKK